MSQYEYYAFISYKSEDAKWAEWLQKKIEHYKLPTSLFEEYPDIPHTIRPIFRDKSDLGAGILPKELNTALNTSKFLIVICSKNATNSTWVNNEVQHFIDAGRTDYIIPFIVDGIPYSGDANECFPEAIRKLKGMENELLGININELGKDAASVKVVARLLGLKFDALWGRYLKEEEKEKQRLIEQNNRLRTSKERASINKAFALVDSGQNLLAARIALDIIDNDKKEGWKPLPEVEHLLRASTMGSQEELFPLLSFDDNFLFSPDGRFLLLWNRLKVQLIELEPYSVMTNLQLSEWNGGPVFDLNSKYMAIADLRKIHIVGLGEAITNKTINVEPDSVIEAMRFVCLADELSLCVVYSDGTITVYNPMSGEMQYTLKAEINQSHHISKAVLCDNYAIVYTTDCESESDGYIVYKVSIRNGTAEIIGEGYSLHSEDCTKLLYFFRNESVFMFKDLVTNEVHVIHHRGDHPFYLSNSGLICFYNEDNTVAIVGSQGCFFAKAPISRFWLSKDEKSCAFSLRDMDGDSIVYFNSDINQCPNHDGYIDIMSNAIEIQRYKGTYLENLKVFGQHYVATGGDFGVDIFDAHENRLVRHSDKGNNIIISSDFHHLIVSWTMDGETSYLYRYSPFFSPLATVHDYDILTVDPSGAPIYYNLDHKGYIEFFTEDGNTHTIALKSEKNTCSLLDVNKNRLLAAFRVKDRPAYIINQDGHFDDSSVIIVNLKDFRCIDSVSSKVFQQDKRIIRFSHDGKWLLSIISMIKGWIAFSYEIATKQFSSFPIPNTSFSYRSFLSNPFIYDRIDNHCFITDKAAITLYLEDGRTLSEMIVGKEVFSLYLLNKERVLAYPFLFDIKKNAVSHLENAPEEFSEIKFDIDENRDLFVACTSDNDYQMSIYIWQISSCKLLFSQTNIATTGYSTPHISEDCICWKNSKLPYPNFEKIYETIWKKFSGYELDKYFREMYYLE